jgi:hypothetical protein
VRALRTTDAGASAPNEAFAVSEPEFSDVFLAGKDGYKSIRIPSVVVTSSGTVLAFAEGTRAIRDRTSRASETRSQPSSRKSSSGKTACDRLTSGFRFFFVRCLLGCGFTLALL